MNAQLDTLNFLRSRIAQKAYDLYQERVQNNHPGNEVEDWLTAEKLILSEFNPPKASKKRVSRKVPLSH